MPRSMLFVVLVSLWSTAGMALPITYTATLSGPAEHPANASPGSGSVIAVLDTAAHTLQLDVSFSGLMGTTTAAHIHCCVSPSAATPIAGVASTTPTFPGFPSGVTSGSYSHTFDLTQASSWNATFVTTYGSIAGAETALANGLAAGHAYLNIHTSVYGGGEIRGFMVPEPSTMALLTTGLVLLAARRRSLRAQART